MTKSKIAEFENYDVKFVVKDDKKWFDLRDVCKVLGFSNPRQAISSHVVTHDVQKISTVTNGGKQLINYINESGIFALALSSKKENAKKFKHWVTSDVLVSIKDTGSYSITEIDEVKQDCFNKFTEEKNCKSKIIKIMQVHRELKKQNIFDNKSLIKATLKTIEEETGINTQNYTEIVDSFADVNIISSINTTPNNFKTCDLKNNTQEINTSELQNNKNITTIQLKKILKIDDINIIYEMLENKGLIYKTKSGLKLTEKGKLYGQEKETKTLDNIEYVEFLWFEKIKDL